MLYYTGIIVKPENRNIEPTGKEAAHALVPLVESGVRIAVRLRPDSDLPVDVPLPGGNLHSQGSAGGHQHRARPGPGAGLLRPAPGLLPQPGPRSEQAYPRLVRSGLPIQLRHPSRQASSPSSSATASRSPRPDAKCPGSKSSIKNPTQTPSRSTSSATPAKRSPCSPKPCPAYSPCLWPVASMKVRCFPTATTEPCWTRWSCCSTRWT